MEFEFATAERIIFGVDTFSQVGAAAARLGRRYLVVVGSRVLHQQGIVGRLARELGAAGLEVHLHHVQGEPDVDAVDTGARRALDASCDGVVGIGGGSAIDTAKAIAALMTNGGSALDYMEVVGLGKSIDRPAAPLIAIPTTAGTGAEVTRNAVIAHRPSGLKASLRSPHLLPKIALVDPLLTHSLPTQVTAATGMDALTQLVEPYVSRRAQPVTDALAREGIPRVARSLIKACLNPRDGDARTDMSLASLLGGMALANSGLGAVHGFAAAIGGSHSIPHGVICATLLPHVMGANIRALRERVPSSAALTRYAEIGRYLLGSSESDEGQSADAGVAFVEDLCRHIGIPTLLELGVTPDDVPSIVRRAQSASSMKANPVALTSDELTEVLISALA